MILFTNYGFNDAAVMPNIITDLGAEIYSEFQPHEYHRLRLVNKGLSPL